MKKKALHNYVDESKDTTFESQEAGEKVYFVLRRHPVTNIGWILMALLSTLVPPSIMEFLSVKNIDTFRFIPEHYQIILIIIWYMFTLFLAFESFLLWYFSTYIITDKRVIDVDFTGFWSKRISEAPLGNVEDATYQTNKFMHILFNYGNIYMQTAGEKTEFEFYAVPNPGLVHDVLTDLVEDYKNGNKR